MLKYILIRYPTFSNHKFMRTKILFPFFILIFIIACTSIKPHLSSFENQFFNDRKTQYVLRKNTLNNEINIFDEEKLITKKNITFIQDSLRINITNEKKDRCDFTLQQYTVNHDLAFIVLWKNRGNKALWFFLNKGQNNKKWYITEAIEKRIR